MKKLFVIITIFALMYIIGNRTAYFVNHYITQHTIAQIRNEQTENWGLHFDENGKTPSSTISKKELSKYHAYYVGDETGKRIYLTFDCGYENGNTELILDALKKHNVKATFFVVGHFIDSAPDIVKRMVEEGHTIGNHTEHHYDMSKIINKENFVEEIQTLEEKYKQLTGLEMLKYYRPPQGKFCTENLTMANEMGYKTFFWSLAYVDWNQDKQPSKEEAMKKLTERIHPGAVVLLHTTSTTNGLIMDDILTEWEKMGYTFGVIEELQ